MFTEEKGFSREQTQRLVVRCNRFSRLLEDGQAAFLYEKLAVDSVALSLKIIPLSIFLWEFIDMPLDLMTQRHDQEVYIAGYKPTTSIDIVSEQRNFFGQAWRFQNTITPLAHGEAISAIPSAKMLAARFYAGEHHGHLFPRLKVLYDRDGSVGSTVEKFKDILRIEYEIERQAAPVDQQPDLLAIMDRLPFFSPQVVNEAGRLFVYETV